MSNFLKQSNKYKKEYDLICMGRVGVDLYSQQIDSTLKDAQTFSKYLGGSPGNISIGASRLGLKTMLFSGIGNDDLGLFLQETLQKNSVSTKMLFKMNNHLTALAVLGVQPPNSFPLLFFRENCADMQLKISDIDEELIAKTKFFLFSGTGISTDSMRSTTKFVLNLCKKYDTKIILDIDYRPVLWGLTAAGNGEARFRKSSDVTNIYKSFLPFCDLVVGTSEELCIASGTNNANKFIEIIQSYSKSDIVHKTGLKGSCVVLYGSENPIQVKSFKVDVFNTLGSGDAYMSGLLFGLLNGKSWSQSLTYANACGALVCSRHSCSSAMPNITELNYFIQEYKKVGQKVLSDKKLSRYHRDISIGRPEDYPLMLLAYDHRKQFEKTCDEYNVKRELVNKYKNLLFSAFEKAVKYFNGEKSLGIICDPFYGAASLKKSIEKNFFALVPIENYKSNLLEWIDEDCTSYEILNCRPKNWGVKVLWKYHQDQSEQIKNHQMSKLKELSRSCDSLDRKLMLELIIPEDYILNGTSISSIMSEVYQNNIYPFWWKLQMLQSSQEWRKVDSIIETYDSNARIILLGGKVKPLDDYKLYFDHARSSRFVNGFAFGRSIFWDYWILFCQKKIQENEVIDLVLKKYIDLISIWKKNY